MKRIGTVIGIKPERIAEYKRLHANIWPTIIDIIRDSNIRNYSIYLKEPENLLFSYFEYVGRNFVADMKKMSDNDVTQSWWDICMPCQNPLDARGSDDWWSPMEEVFYCE